MPNGTAVELVVDNKGIQSVKIPMMKGLSNEPTGESYFYNRGKVADGQDPNKFYINEAAKKNRNSDEFVLSEKEFYDLMRDLVYTGRPISVDGKKYSDKKSALEQINKLEMKALTSSVDLQLDSVEQGTDVKNLGLNNKINVSELA